MDESSDMNFTLSVSDTTATEQSYIKRALKNSSTQQNTQSGGFFDKSSSSMTEFTLNMINNEYITPDNYFRTLIQYSEFMLSHNILPDLSIVDGNHRNIAYHLLIASNNPFVTELLNKLYNSSEIKKYINDQDVQGNTLAHYALKRKRMDHLHILVQLGIDLSIENNEGECIEKGKQQNVVNENVSINLVSVQTAQPNGSEQHKILDEAIDKLIDDTYSHASFTFDRNDALASLQETDKEVDSVGTKQKIDEMIQILEQNTDDEDEQVESLFSQESDAVVESMGGGLNSSEFLDRLTKRYGGQSGGAKRNKKITASSRKLLTYSNMENTIESSDNSSDDEKGYDTDEITRNVNELSRTISHDADKLHQEAITNIMKTLSIKDKDEAELYKSILYKKIRDEKPALTYMDRAKQLVEWSSDKKILNSVDKKQLDELREHRKSTKQMTTESDSKKKVRKQSRVTDDSMSSTTLDVSDSD